MTSGPTPLTQAYERAQPATQKSYAPALDSALASTAHPPLGVDYHFGLASNRSDAVRGLGRGEMLFWGTVGLLVHRACNSPSQHRSSTIDNRFTLDQKTHRVCVECQRIERRALASIVQGLFATDP